MPCVHLEEARRFIFTCLTHAGASEDSAQDQASLLIHADCIGHLSHGLFRLEFYVNEIKSGRTNGSAQPEILREELSTAWVDGRSALGATVAKFCMETAIKKAKNTGIGWVSAKNCNHFGVAGYWALMAEKEDLIGMAFTNSSPIMVPTRAKEAALGTNPISMAAPSSDGRPLLVDMAMTTTAMGKIDIQVRKGETIPDCWALGPDGNITTDGQAVLDSPRLLPLGGFESNSGYKGYGLAAMVEMFCSGLSGSNPSHKVKVWSAINTSSDGPNLGQCFVAINPDCFAPGFKERVAECTNYWRHLEPVDASKPVMVPGDKIREKYDESMSKGYIVYSQIQIEACNKLASRLGVAQIKVKQ